jgi:hypothetical protein
MFAGYDQVLYPAFNQKCEFRRAGIVRPYNTTYLLCVLASLREITSWLLIVICRFAPIRGIDNGVADSDFRVWRSAVLSPRW